MGNAHPTNPTNPTGQFWIPEMQIFLGVWQDTRENRDGHWLRWWDESGNLLLLGTERVIHLSLD